MDEIDNMLSPHRAAQNLILYRAVFVGGWQHHFLRGLSYDIVVLDQPFFEMARSTACGGVAGTWWVSCGFELDLYSATPFTSTTGAAMKPDASAL